MPTSLRHPRIGHPALFGAVAATLATVGLAAGSSPSDSTASAASASVLPTHPPSEHTIAATPDRVDPVTFRQEMRRLWEDHVTWTRLYIVSALAELADLEATADRLLQNQDDIGAAVATFYGADAGAALTELLREHILVAADLVAAAKAGDDAALSAESDLWYANADEIARFLATANPAWPYETMRSMMNTHLDQTIVEVTARLTEDWAGDVAAYDDIHHHILEMADALADGIITQFPDRFAMDDLG